MSRIIHGRSPGMYEIPYAEIIAQTPRAWLIMFNDADDEDDKEATEKWLPKSQCEIDEGECTIWIPQWLIEEEDLEDLVE